MNPQGNKFLNVFKSRKFWASIVGVGFVVAKAYDPNFPIDEQQVIALVAVVVSYILGTSLEDGLRVKG